MATDALVSMEKAMKRDKIEVNDRQLACARIHSKEGQDYLNGMAAAANYAWVSIVFALKFTYYGYLMSYFDNKSNIPTRSFLLYII